MTAPGPPVPIACSLDAGARAGRMEEWRALVASSVVDIDAGATSVRMVLDDAPASLETAVSLGQREKRCCAFFDVAIELGPDSRTLSLRVPAGAEETLAAFVALLTTEEGSDGERGHARWVDAEVGDRPGHHGGVHAPAQGQLLEHGDDEVGGVDLEVRAQRGPGIGAAEPVGPE